CHAAATSWLARSRNRWPRICGRSANPCAEAPDAPTRGSGGGATTRPAAWAARLPRDGGRRRASAPRSVRDRAVPALTLEGMFRVGPDDFRG
ncbi:MAG: hypothetical protein AVDCRST_MAG59-2856, partial [uncultured Thermomicrobiales bacterium]